MSMITGTDFLRKNVTKAKTLLDHFLPKCHTSTRKYLDGQTSSIIGTGRKYLCLKVTGRTSIYNMTRSLCHLSVNSIRLMGEITDVL